VNSAAIGALSRRAGQRPASEFLAARSYRYPNGRRVRGGCLLLAGGNWFASGREQLVAPRRLVDHKFQVLGKKVALVNQAPGLLSHLFEVPNPARWRSAIDRRGSPLPARSCSRSAEPFYGAKLARARSVDKWCGFELRAVGSDISNWQRK
jgi:hypothetical protein